MRPRKDDDALVDVLDVLLRDGLILRADVIVSVAEIPLVGIKLTAAIAGMETMNEYGFFEEWDARRRRRALEAGGSDGSPDAELDRLTVGHKNTETDSDRTADSDEDESE